MGCTSSTIASSISELNAKGAYPVYGGDGIMKGKAHGTCATPVQSSLRWNVDAKRADKICNYNRHFAEPSGVFDRDDKFKKEMARAKKNGEAVKFYDSNSGHLLFQAPIGRSHDDFWKESQRHGWPSFRDNEVNWEYVRCLRNGETVSIHGTHLGHNLPDRTGNRYCINLCCVAGNPVNVEESTSK